MPIAIGMTRKIAVHLTLLNSAERNTGSAKMARNLSSPTKVGVDSPSHSTNAMAIVSRAGIRIIRTLMASAGNRNGMGDLLPDWRTAAAGFLN